MDDVTPSRRSSKPTIAVFSGATATIANSAPLVTSNKAREQYGLPLRAHPDGSLMRWDVVRPQRLARPVTVYIEQFSAHPLERDAAELYASPDGYLDPQGVLHPTRQSPNDVPVYEVTPLRLLSRAGTAPGGVRGGVPHGHDRPRDGH